MKEKSLSSHQQAAQALRDARIHKKPITRISETYGIEGLEATYKEEDLVQELSSFLADDEDDYQSFEFDAGVEELSQ